MKFNFNIDDIKYVKILFKDENQKPKTIKAAIKKINEQEIVACARFDTSYNPIVPQEITLSIVCNDGLYRTLTGLKGVEMDTPYTIFLIETPKGFEYQQNREYFRISADFDCMYYVTNEGKTEMYSAVTYDISASGVSIILPNQVLSEKDSELDIMIEDRLIRTKVRYVRSEQFETGYKLSFAYMNISNGDKDYISQVCIKRQLQQRKNSVMK